MLYFSPDTANVYGWEEIKVIQAADNSGTAAVPTEIEVMQTGEWDTPGHGKFSITEDDLNEYVANFNSGTRKGVPIDLEHKTDGGAVGWVKDLTRKGTSLFANVEWNNAGAQMLADKAYRFFSPEFAPRGYKDPEGKQTADRNVLIGGALTNRPLFKNLTAIVANDAGNGSGSTSGLTGDSGKDNNNSNKGDVMQLDEIRKLDPAQLTEEQKTFLGDHKAELSVAEQSAFGLVVKSEAEIAAEAKAVADKAAADKEAADAAAAAKVEADKVAVAAAEGGSVTIKASDLQAMNAKIEELSVKANEGVKAAEQLRYKEASDKVKALTFNDGKFKPAGQKSITDFYIGLSAEQQAAFDKDVVGNINTTAIAAGEVGADNTGELTEAGEKLDKRAEEIMASDKIPYSDALKKARDENPALAKQYEADLQPTKAEV